MTALETAVTDQAQRDLITRTGLDRTLFVDAGAGSGKTTQLVDRIVHLVVDGDVNLSEIAAITFTEAAAAELHDRVRVAFEERAERAPAGSDEERRCRDALAEADLAAITTLHGFARRILAEHPIAAGLPPTVEILDEVSSQLESEARWLRFVDRLHHGDEHEELLLRAAAADVPLEPRYQGHATLKDVAVELAQAWDRIEPVAARQHGPLPALDFSAFDRAVEELVSGLDDCDDAADKHYLHVTQKLLPALLPLCQDADPLRRLRALAAGPGVTIGPGNGGKAANWGDLSAAKQRAKYVKEALDSVLATVADDVLTRLMTMVCREVLDAAHARRAEGRVEFHDLLVLARSMLRSRAEVRRTLHDRYRRVLLDEFQDTDPIQIELAVLIAGAAHGSEAHWSDVDVEPGRLFFVGDPKQSIYRFRRADIALFLDARDRFGSDGGHCSLTTNFRTVSPVLGWVNDLFAGLMGDGEPGSQPAYEPLVPHRAELEPGAHHEPVLLGGPCEGMKAGELREREAAAVADAIDAIRRRPDEWKVHDTTDKTWRPAQLSDITILLPTRTSLPYLRDALDDASIPYRLDTGTLVYDSQEVRDVLAVLRSVDDPTDQRSLVAALRSPLYGCSDPDLFTFVQAGGTWNLDDPVRASVPLDHPVRLAIEHIGTLAADRWWSSPSDLVHRVLREREAFLLGFGVSRPADVWRRLRFLVDQARLFDETVGGTTRAFLAWADLQQSGSAAVHEPLLPETDNRAVRIMTIHGAKGLEFPITILSGMTTKPAANRRGVSLLWDGDEPAVKLRGGIATENHDARADLEERMNVHEKLRLLYVGCTRARDHLLVSCTHKPDDGSYASQIWEHANRSLSRTLPELPPRLELVEEVVQLALPDDDRGAWIATREATLAPHRDRRVRSATAIAAAMAEGSDLADVDDDAADQPVPVPLRARRSGRAATAIGRAVHAALEQIDLAQPHDIDAVAVRQADAEGLDDHEPVSALVRSALTSSAAALAAGHPHHRELYVAAPVGEHVVEGYVDLLVESDEGLVVIDWKTDRVRGAADAEAAAARHAPQGAAYALALEVATGLPVAEVRFVFCRETAPIEISVPDLRSSIDSIRAHLGAPD